MRRLSIWLSAIVRSRRGTGCESFALAKMFAVGDVRNGVHVGCAAALKVARFLCDASRAARQAPTEIPPALPCKGITLRLTNQGVEAGVT